VIERRAAATSIRTCSAQPAHRRRLMPGSSVTTGTVHADVKSADVLRIAEAFEHWDRGPRLPLTSHRRPGGCVPLRRTAASSTSPLPNAPTVTGRRPRWPGIKVRFVSPAQSSGPVSLLLRLGACGVSTGMQDRHRITDIELTRDLHIAYITQRDEFTC
jgi:hypothetical protein